VTTSNILSINRGSSSLKFALYAFGEGPEELLARGEVEQINLDRGRLWIERPGGKDRSEISGEFGDSNAAVLAAFAAMKRLGLPRPDAAGNRLVHGGPTHVAPERITAELIASIRDLVRFAPLHLPIEIQAIEAITARLPDLPQVACFDTSFHQRMPEAARRLPLPRSWWDEGVRRYGFHGISYEYIMQALGVDPPDKIVIAHLGNGASMVAVRDGKPIDTTMGLTPTGGLMMGTRSGDLDPGVLLFMLTQKNYSNARLEQLINRESGLLGVSATSSDVRTLIEQRDADPRASQAIEMFCYQIGKQIGAYSAALGGLDLLVFTGGIGEHAAPIREQACHRLGFIGIQLDQQRNRSNAEIISTIDSRCAVRVIPTNEDLMIARHTQSVLAGNSEPK
jgi:acetate kinase